MARQQSDIPYRQRNTSINVFDYLEKTTYITNFNVNFKLTWKKSFYDNSMFQNRITFFLLQKKQNGKTTE